MKLSEVKENIMKPVMYDGTRYILTECILWADVVKRQYRYSCTLLDKSKNCTVWVPVERVEPTKRG